MAAEHYELWVMVISPREDLHNAQCSAKSYKVDAVFIILENEIIGTPPGLEAQFPATNKYKLSGGVVIAAIHMTRSRFLFKTHKGLCQKSPLLSLRQEKNRCNKFVLARALALIPAILLPWS